MWSHIQPNKKKSVMGWTNFEKGVVSNIGGLHKIGGLGILFQLWFYLTCSKLQDVFHRKNSFLKPLVLWAVGSFVTTIPYY